MTRSSTMTAMTLAAVTTAWSGGAPIDQNAPVSLDDDLQPLIEHFNAGRGKPRVVALVSSTCPACVFGAKAVRTAVLEAYPEADLHVSIVWIDMLPTDNAAAALQSSVIFRDPRVKQFHDPGRRSGHAIGAGLLNRDAGPAWDIYLYYDAEAVWAGTPPAPVEWYHQLSGTRRADPARFRPGSKLVATLKAATARVAGIAEAAPVEVPDRSTPGCAPPPSLQVLSFPGCPNAEEMCRRLEQACREIGLTCSIERVNLRDLPEDDPRRGWGSPTALLNGADLMGAETGSGGALSCRIYPGTGIPTVQEMIERLRPDSRTE